MKFFSPSAKETSEPPMTHISIISITVIRLNHIAPAFRPCSGAPRKSRIIPSPNVKCTQKPGSQGQWKAGGLVRARYAVARSQLNKTPIQETFDSPHGSYVSQLSITHRRLHPLERKRTSRRADTSLFTRTQFQQMKTPLHSSRFRYYAEEAARSQQPIQRVYIYLNQPYSHTKNQKERRKRSFYLAFQCQDE